MTLSFVEIPDFTEVIDDYFGTDEHYLRLQLALIQNPEAGAVIPGTGGLRKVRWPDPRRGKGKRGGLRVIYLYMPASSVIGFLDVYDKDEAEDMTAAGKQALAIVAKRVQKEYGRPR